MARVFRSILVGVCVLSRLSKCTPFDLRCKHRLSTLYTALAYLADDGIYTHTLRKKVKLVIFTKVTTDSKDPIRQCLILTISVNYPEVSITSHFCKPVKHIQIK